jgi:hypothetical protein
MTRYIVLTEDGSCGHMHRHYGKAVDCLDRFEDNGIPAKLVGTVHNVDPLFIDKHLLKRTSMDEMAAFLQSPEVTP